MIKFTNSMSYEDEDIVLHTIEKEELQIAIGSILGDGYLTALSKKGKSRLWIKYDDKAFSYLMWIRDKLKPFGVGLVKKKKGYNQHYFLTDSSDILGGLQKIFYPDGHTKCVPENIRKLLLKPIALAGWYMDDGHFDWRFKYHRNPTIATYCFSHKDCICLTETLCENFRIQSKVHKCTMRGKVYNRLYILSNSVDKFFNLIKPYIHPHFLYKIQEGRQQPR